MISVWLTLPGFTYTSPNARDGELPAGPHWAGEGPDLGPGGEVHCVAGGRPQPEGLADGGLADGDGHHQTLQRGQAPCCT